MYYYQEFTLIKDSEISIYFIWSKFYTQLHLAFVEQKDIHDQIIYGISFPEYKIVEAKGKKITIIGSKLRIFANSIQALEQLKLDIWLERLKDYVHIKSPKVVENVTQYLIVNRYRPQTNVGALARRYANRHGVSLDVALKRLEGFKQKLEPFPYIRLKSLSGGSDFSLCINQKVTDKENVGRFSTYGLSATSTVPHW
jgi:CRISPR-associated endonuclease Csy4